MFGLIRRFKDDKRGATAVEYGLIIACIVLTLIGGFGQAADALQFMFGNNASKLQQAFQ